MAASPEQLHELLKYCMGFAKIMLEDSGTFYPFGAAIGTDGRLGGRGGYDGEEHPEPLDIYELISGGLTRDVQAGSVLAIALAANVDIPSEYDPPSPDGLRVLLETEGYCRFIYVPYVLVKKGIFTKPTIANFSEPFAVDVPPQIFAKLDS
jgi:hypothetical protein